VAHVAGSLYHVHFSTTMSGDTHQKSVANSMLCMHHVSKVHHTYTMHTCNTGTQFFLISLIQLFPKKK